MQYLNCQGGGGLVDNFHAFKFTLKQYNNDILFVAFVSVRYMYMQNRACLILVKCLTIQIKGERGGGGASAKTYQDTMSQLCRV